MVVFQRKTLRPSSRRILTFKHHVDNLFKRFPVYWIVLFNIHAKQEFGCHNCPQIIKSSITIVMTEFFQSPSVFPDCIIPALQRILTGKIEHIIPSATFKLSPDQGIGHLPGRLIIIFITCCMVSVQQQMPHRRSSRWLDPYHRTFRLHLSP